MKMRILLLLLAAPGSVKALANDNIVNSTTSGSSGSGNAGTLAYVAHRLDTRGSMDASTVTFAVGGTCGLSSQLSIIRPVSFAVDPLVVGEVVVQKPAGIDYSISSVVEVGFPGIAADGIRAAIAQGIRFSRSTTSPYAYGINWAYTHNSWLDVLGGTLDVAGGDIAAALCMPDHIGSLDEAATARIGTFSSTSRPLATGCKFPSGMLIGYNGVARGGPLREGLTAPGSEAPWAS